MSSVKSKRAPAPGGGSGTPRLATAWLVNSASPTKTGLLKIPVLSKTVKALAANPGVVSGLIDAYVEALEKSRRGGPPVRFEVDVGPDGVPGITSVEHTSRAPAANEEALDAARSRGRARVAEILRGDEMLSAEAFATLIGTSRMTVNVWRQNQQVLGLEGAKRGYRFPAWQIDGHGKPLPALPAIFERLGGGPWAAYFFLVRPHAELGGITGLEALRRGRVTQALDAAESIARGDFT
jgi:hypothetical protein